MEKKGFTLVEVMIVIALIAILTCIAIPNLLRSRLNANERYATSNVQTISVAAQTYWSVKNVLPSTLLQLNAEGLLDGSLGCASQPCIKNGYKYYMGGSGLRTDFFIYTIPQTSNDGVQSFCAGSDGVTRVSATGETPANQAACNAWGSL
ncbi:MAG: prepilin-type N-terminal cleavage/methylation domain-containing protein [Candidatus Omnitrophica bacterium]|nr:prepilin-type N-terminal cleavage/methylation domain-containing protein [Candidatus Omnitrophota bacterium]